MLIYNTIQTILLVITGSALLYIFFFSVAGLLYKQKKLKTPDKFKKVAVLIPAYKEDAVIIEVAKSALQQSYPMSAFDVIVIADSLQEETLAKLRFLPIKLIEVAFTNSTKSKALNKALEQLPSHYDIAVVLDADNIMGVDFLSKVNAAFYNGSVALQGHRTAKNINNAWAILDAISEEINNHIFRKGHRTVGLSAALIGSGMAFEYYYFKHLMLTVNAVGGFDKEIELKIIKQGIKIDYLDDAYVYDEKVQEPEVFSNQRRRWLSAQLHYFRYGFPDACKALFISGNTDYFDKAIQFIQPPRILLLGAVLLFGTGFIVINGLLDNHTYSIAWYCVIGIALFSVLACIPVKFMNKRTIMAISSLPVGVLLMAKSLMNIKGANKKFIHTKHNSASSTNN